MRLLLAVAIILVALILPFIPAESSYATDNTSIAIGFSENISIGDITVSAGDSFTASIRDAMKGALQDVLDSTVGKIISLGFSLVAIIILSIWAFKSRYPVAFQLLAGVSLIVGFRWYDSFGTTDALAISLALIAFSFCMAGTALYTMLAAPKESEE